jgi:hypothetical protein
MILQNFTNMVKLNIRNCSALCEKKYFLVSIRKGLITAFLIEQLFGSGYILVRRNLHTMSFLRKQESNE